MDFKDLTPDQLEKARACKTPDDIVALAKEEGYELSDEELEAVSGGDWDCWTVCGEQCSGYNSCPHDIYP